VALGTPCRTSPLFQIGELVADRIVPKGPGGRGWPESGVGSNKDDRPAPEVASASTERADVGTFGRRMTV